MAAFLSPPPTRISLPFPQVKPNPSQLLYLSNPAIKIFSNPHPSFPHLRISTNLSQSNSSIPSTPDSNTSKHPPKSKGIPMFITLPIDLVDSDTGAVKNAKAMKYTLMAFKLARIEGIVMEAWWSRVEKEEMEYNWAGYLEVVKWAESFGLKVRVVMGFHQVGDPGVSTWIALPSWVRTEMINQPGLAYKDRFGRMSYEYNSMGCDTLPVLNRRSPIQAYSDFMRSFKETFDEFLGDTITGVQVSMGPSGELRYPAALSRKMTSSWPFHELGEFQCYDKYMLESLSTAAQEIGMPEWGIAGPSGTGELISDRKDPKLDEKRRNTRKRYLKNPTKETMKEWAEALGPIPQLRQHPEETEFFKSDGSWNTSYGKFFLEWYSEMLLLHGERLCMAAETVFSGTGVSILAKVAGIYWHYSTESHASELTAGYYNTADRDGYLPIALMFASHGVTLCCSGFEMKDEQEKRISSLNSPEGVLRQILLASRAFNLPLDAELSAGKIRNEAFIQALEMAKFHSDGFNERGFSFNLVRMNQNLLNRESWKCFSDFVKQMSDGRDFKPRFDSGQGDMFISSTSGTEEGGADLAYC